MSGDGRHLEAREAELSVLGAILLDNSAFDRVADSIRDADFHVPAHRVVFAEMGRLAAGEQPIDTVTLSSNLRQQGLLADVGGVDYLISLDKTAATAINVEHHARIIRDASEARGLIAACAELIEKTRSGDYDSTSALLDEAQALMHQLGQRPGARGFTDLDTAVKAVLKDIQAAYDAQSTVTGVPTGFIDLDRLTAGLQPGDLIVLAARPAMGKTALALNLASNAAALAHCTVAVFSLEMPTAQLTKRMLASCARVDSERMRTGHLADGDIDRTLQAAARMTDWSVHIDDTAGVGVMEIRSKCRRLASDRSLPPLGLVVIDYLQLMKGRAGIRNREQEISDISRNLKGLAKELDVPVVALSQLNRGVESRPQKRPLMSDLRESGAIEQDADIIAFVYRDEYYYPDSEDVGMAEIILAKQRNGPIGTVKLRFFKEWSRFDNLVP